jgi:hydrogenase expression/formation protein HypE
MAGPRRSRPKAPPEGKIPHRFFERAVRQRLGARRPDVLIGPQIGVDVGVVRLPGAGVLIATTDPLYVEPRLGWDRAAWFAFHILASDLTTSGCRPDWATIDLDVPPETPDSVLETLLRVFDREARALGTAIVTGHTGRYPGCAFPIVGSGTLLAAASADGFVTTRQIRTGAILLMARTAGLEATGMLATFFPDRIRDDLGNGLLQKARSFTGQMSTVPVALQAADVGLREEGVWAMHDATEGGVRAAVWEMAEASGRGIEADLTKAWVDPVVAEVARLFEMDPLDASSEGTLLLAAEPSRCDDIEAALRQGGSVVSRIGRFTSQPRLRKDGRRVLQPAERDSYWLAVRRESSELTHRTTW